MASGRFQPAAICQAMEEHCGGQADLAVKRSSNPWFMYSSGNSTHGLLRDDSEDTLSRTTPAELLRSCMAGGEFTYFNAPLSSVAPALVSAEQTETIAWWKDSQATLNVWIGSAGCRTQLHYDTEDNVFLQLEGRKRFRFFSPAVSERLHLYPDAHPRARKSMLDMDGVDAARFPRFARDGAAPPCALDVTLEPGEAVLIPALWLHEVRTSPYHGPSVSLSCFTRSGAWVQAERLLALPTPFGDDASAVFRLFAFLGVLLPQIAKSCLASPSAHAAPGAASGAASSAPTPGAAVPEGDGRADGSAGRADEDHVAAAHFVTDALLAARYSPLLGAGAPIDRASAESVRAAVDAEGSLNGRSYAAHARSFADAFRQLEAAHGDGGATRLVLAHLVELWLVRLVGAEKAAPVLELYVAAART